MIRPLAGTINSRFDGQIDERTTARPPQRDATHFFPSRRDGELPRKERPMYTALDGRKDVPRELPLQARSVRGGPRSSEGDHEVQLLLSTLDDLLPTELVSAPQHYANGKDDDWFHEPAEKQHL
jgi:hypothetical protein